MSSSTEFHTQEENDKICILESQINELTLALDETKTQMDSIKSLNPWVNENTRDAMYTYMKESAWIPNTKFIIAKNEVTSRGLSMQMWAALSAYSGPPAQVTSIVRDWTKSSSHYTGDAIDIRWDESGKLFAYWLVSDAGKEWVREYNLKILFENLKENEFRSGKFRKFYKNNPNATAPHIHIECTKKVRL